MKYLLAVLAVGALVVVLAVMNHFDPCSRYGMASEQCINARNDAPTRWTKTPDGRTIPCKFSGRGDIDCDWEYGR